MSIEEACRRVLGRDAAQSITAETGLHWCVVAAMAACKVSHGKSVKAAIDAYVAEMKRDTERMN